MYFAVLCTMLCATYCVVYHMSLDACYALCGILCVVHGMLLYLLLCAVRTQCCVVAANDESGMIPQGGSNGPTALHSNANLH